MDFLLKTQKSLGGCGFWGLFLFFVIKKGMREFSLTLRTSFMHFQQRIVDD